MQILKRYATHPTIVSAAKEQNVKDVSLDDIKTIGALVLDIRNSY